MDRPQAITQLAAYMAAQLPPHERRAVLASVRGEDWSDNPHWKDLPVDIQTLLGSRDTALPESLDPAFEPAIQMVLEVRARHYSGRYLTRALASVGVAVHSPIPDPTSVVACPCCGLGTLDARGEYAICPVCGWEDDGQDNPTATQRGGPNPVSLLEARLQVARTGTMYHQTRTHPQPSTPSHRFVRLRSFAIDPATGILSEAGTDWAAEVPDSAHRSAPIAPADGGDPSE